MPGGRWERCLSPSRRSPAAKKRKLVPNGARAKGKAASSSEESSSEEEEDEAPPAKKPGEGWGGLWLKPLRGLHAHLSFLACLESFRAFIKGWVCVLVLFLVNFLPVVPVSGMRSS